MNFKLHSKSFRIDRSAPIIIGTVNISLSHILAFCNQSSYPVFCFFSEPSYYWQDTRHQLSNIYCMNFHNHTISPPMFYLCFHLNIDIPWNSHNIIFNERLNLKIIPSFAYFYCIFLAKGSIDVQTYVIISSLALFLC